MFALIDSTSGGSARGSEYEGIRFRNDRDSVRHVYLLNNLLSTYIRYSKTQSTRQTANAIVRVPAHAVCKLLIFMLSTVYPAAECLMTIINPSVAYNYHSQLLLQSGQPMTTDVMSKSLQDMTSRGICMALGLRQFRQFNCFILTKLGVVAESTESGEILNEILVKQSNHSLRTADRHYGVQSSNAFPDVAASTIEKQQSSSLSVHIAFGIACPALAKSWGKHEVRSSLFPYWLLLELG